MNRTMDHHSSASVMCSCPQIQRWTRLINPDHFHILHEEIQESNKICFIDTMLESNTARLESMVHTQWSRM